jgi:DMSO/TMAO reductase YedYZ molybdopterin-dependent catalytic subunit
MFWTNMRKAPKILDSKSRKNSYCARAHMSYFRESTMQPKKSFPQGLLVFILIVFIAFTKSTIIIFAESTGETQILETVEVREYEGNDLSSINAFRENSIRGPQYIDAENYILTVSGLVESELELTYDEVVNSYRHFEKVVTLHCVEGWSVNILWEGILVKDLIEAAGVGPSATTVIFYAYDGYSTSLPLNYIINNNIMIAYKMNNITLPPERGFPFQLGAESKWGYKWIKWITTFELSANASYRGYWESRGYSDWADISEPAFNIEEYFRNRDSQIPGIPEFPSWAILPLFLIATFLAIIIRKKCSRL